MVPVDGGGMCLRNVNIRPKYMAHTSQKTIYIYIALKTSDPMMTLITRHAHKRRIVCFFVMQQGQFYHSKDYVY